MKRYQLRVVEPVMSSDSKTEELAKTIINSLQDKDADYFEIKKALDLADQVLLNQLLSQKINEREGRL